ncbi:hypothetical protein NL444_27940, partial [Klebsiella pneumoniae]|nr:hypothetical protein [Klebsiella pneumoniae]
MQQQLPMRQVVQAPLIELLVIDQRFDGDRFRARVTDGASDSPVANALVTFSIDGEPVRVLETHENGTT